MINIEDTNTFRSHIAVIQATGSAQLLKTNSYTDIAVFQLLGSNAIVVDGLAISIEGKVTIETIPVTCSENQVHSAFRGQLIVKYKIFCGICGQDNRLSHATDKGFATHIGFFHKLNCSQVIAIHCFYQCRQFCIVRSRLTGNIGQGAVCDGQGVINCQRNVFGIILRIDAGDFNIIQTVLFYRCITHAVACDLTGDGEVETHGNFRFKHQRCTVETDSLCAAGNHIGRIHSGDLYDLGILITLIGKVFCSIVVAKIGLSCGTVIQHSLDKCLCRFCVITLQNVISILTDGISHFLAD